MPHLTPAQFQTIRRRLAAGVRHVAIARELGLSLWTIARVADRRRYVEADALEAEIPAEELCEDDSPPDYAAANLRRCQGCGAMVYLWPCISCSHGASAPAIAPPADAEKENGQFHQQPRKLRRKLRSRHHWSRSSGAPANSAPSVSDISRGLALLTQGAQVEGEDK